VLIFSQLRATKNELDTRTEDMSAAFVEGKMELSKFLTVRCCLPNFAVCCFVVVYVQCCLWRFPQEYLEQRGKYHELSAKLKILGK
jgi:hypothetical protein